MQRNPPFIVATDDSIVMLSGMPDGWFILDCLLLLTPWREVEVYSTPALPLLLLLLKLMFVDFYDVV